MPKRKVYILDCNCGNKIELSIGQAGTELQCRSCNETHRAGSLGELVEAGIISKEFHDKPTVQFGIWSLLRLTVPIAILLAIGARTDWYILVLAVTILAGFCFIVVAVAAFLHFSPRILAAFWDLTGMSKEDRLE